MTTTTIPQTFAEAELALAESLPGYEPRPQQQALAQAVEEHLAQGSHLIAEAGCGTGKSLGYLIPAILSGKRVVVATATKALQDQIANKDLPFLQEHLGVPFTWAVLKGRSNYICTQQVEGDGGERVSSIEEVKVTITTRHAEPTFLGERDDFDHLTDMEWRDLTVSGEECPGKNSCVSAKAGRCFAERAKQFAKQAQIIVVNHALMFTDLMVKEYGGGGMLDEFDAVIFDEAHEAEEYAASMLGTQMRQSTFISLASNIRSFVNKIDRDDPILGTLDRMLGAAQALWDLLEPGRVRQGVILEHEEEWAKLGECLIAVTEELADFSLDNLPPQGFEKIATRKRVLLQRANNLRVKFIDIVTGSEDNLVRWVEQETTRKGDKRLVLRSAPINVAPILRQWLFERYPTILVSATILVEGEADYISQRLGIDSYDAIDVGTPFDYPTQSRYYIPSSLPAPDRNNREAWESISIEVMRDLIVASKGRALLLFTSTTMMRKAFESISPRVPFECRKQGDAPNNTLGEWFKENTDSVLFATRSFMTGFDVQGESLSLVVIDKMPFPVPTEALVEARTEQIERRGGNSFNDYIIPVMALVLKQAHGRLIRHRGDTGVVAILDSRMVVKGYGKKILRALPEAPALSSIGEVEAFLS